MTSAPEATDPRIVTSPRSNTTDWPERTGSSSTRDDTSAATGAGAVADGLAASSGMVTGRPGLLAAGKGRPQASIPVHDGCAPSVPMMRMPRSSSDFRNPATSGVPAGSAPKSAITGRPSKKVGARAICASSAASHVGNGGSGASTRAITDRPRNRMKGGVSAFVTASSVLRQTRGVNGNRLGEHKMLWITRTMTPYL